MFSYRVSYIFIYFGFVFNVTGLFRKGATALKQSDLQYAVNNASFNSIFVLFFITIVIIYLAVSATHIEFTLCNASFVPLIYSFFAMAFRWDEGNRKS